MLKLSCKTGLTDRCGGLCLCVCRESRMIPKIKRLLRDDSAATAIEYCLIAAGVAFAIIMTVQDLDPGFGLGEIGVPQSENDLRRADFLIRRAEGTGFAALALNLAALIEKILNPCPGRMIGNEVELIPQLVQVLLSLFAEDQFTPLASRP